MEESNRPRRNRRDSERHRRKKKNNTIMMAAYGLLLVVTIFLVYKVGTSVYSFAKGEMTETGEDGAQAAGAYVDVVIPEGSSTKDIAKLLKEKGLIGNEIMFRLKSRFGGFDGAYKHGEYSIMSGMDDEEIMQLLKEGNVNAGKLKLTVPEGYTQQQIADLLASQGIMTAEDFMQEANKGAFDYSFLEGIPDRASRLEGYLFPDTYFLKEGVTAHEVISKMLDRFSQVYTPERMALVEQSEYSLDELITIASIIEAEIQAPEERPIAAGVIYNRLREDMPLQMDSTVLYAMGVTKEVVTYDDLEVDSLYNTYQNTGLPVGPICNPGEAAIEAAIAPAEHKYLYYVLKQRGGGEHEYVETYDEFLKAKETYKNSFEE